MTRVVFLLVLGIASLLAASDGRAMQQSYDRILPVDEGLNDPSFATYRRVLIRAARARDLPRVFSMIARDVRWDEFLAVGGVREFRRYWKVDRKPGEFLKALLLAAEGGGRFAGDGQFIAPYVWTDFPYDFPEIPNYVAVIRESSAIYPSADATTTPLATVSYALLRSGGWGPDGWYGVELNDGRRGFLKRAEGRRPVDVRAYFRKVQGSWKLVVLAQGYD